MKKHFIFYCVLLLPLVGYAQNLPDTLVFKIKHADNDSALVKLYDDAINFYLLLNRDSSQQFINRADEISRRNHQLLMEVYFQARRGGNLTAYERYADSYSILLSALKRVDEINNRNSQWLIRPNLTLEQNKYLLLSNIHYSLHILMHQTSNHEISLSHLNAVLSYAAKVDQNELIIRSSRVNLGRAFTYLVRNKADSAYYLLRQMQMDKSILWDHSFTNMLMGFVLLDKGELNESKQYLQKAISKTDSRSVITRSLLKLSQIYQLQRNPDSSLFYAKKLVATLKEYGNANYEVNIGIAYENLFESYKSLHQKDSAYKYASLAIVSIDSLNKLRIRNLTEFQQLIFNEQQRLEKLEEERKVLINKLTTYGLLFGAFMISLVAYIQFKNSRQRLRANKLLDRQKQEIESTLTQLKETQSQLIQSEKMASLGELTAGIAHEIQNPLNFVNNFSEVNAELIDELTQELAVGNRQLVEEIAKDIKENQQKINHHGKRADAIVKGMLQHSRTSSGQKEPTDINVLCDEYLRLSYHGYRAKDKSFNAKFETNFDSSLEKINVVPQDIGRVVLNLINNAFYAVTEKKKLHGASYEPTVTVSTRRVGSPLGAGGRGESIEISVKDNGSGIPESIKEKIFQPFFTTKPTGQGTGLGLSLSYDIVKAHGGEIKVNSKENEGTEFIVKL